MLSTVRASDLVEIPLYTRTSINVRHINVGIAKYALQIFGGCWDTMIASMDTAGVSTTLLPILKSSSLKLYKPISRGLRTGDRLYINTTCQTRVEVCDERPFLVASRKAAELRDPAAQIAGSILDNLLNILFSTIRGAGATATVRLISSVITITETSSDLYNVTEYRAYS